MSSKIQKIGTAMPPADLELVVARCIADFETRIFADFRNQGMNWAVDVGIGGTYSAAGIDEGYMVLTNNDIKACFDKIISPIFLEILKQIKKLVVMGKHSHVSSEPFLADEICSQNAKLIKILVTGELSHSEYIFSEL